MRVFILFFLSLVTLTSCSKNGNFTVTGTVKGLKKGTLYLQEIQDTLLVNLDSLQVDGNPDFEFTTDLKEPQIMYLHLDKKDASDYDDRILFFAEPGEMTITTSLKDFERFAAIIGSNNQIKWNDFQKINAQFNDQNLDLIKNSFDAQKSGNQEAILKYDDSLNQLLLRRYRYTGNFAITHKDFEIAPYIVLTQIPDASISYLDTIYKSFPQKTQKSMYGKQLKDLIQSRKVQ